MGASDPSRMRKGRANEEKVEPQTKDSRRLTRRKKSWVNPTEHLITTGVNPGEQLIYGETTFKSCIFNNCLFPIPKKTYWLKEK